MDTVILYGTNTFTRHLINWDRNDCEYWCWNEIGSLKDDRPGYWAKRVDLLLQMHAPPIFRNPLNLNHGKHQENGTSNSHYDWLQRIHEIPIYMQEHYDDVPSSVKYPKDEIVAALLPNLKREITEGNKKQIELFTSSFDYACALAIYQNKKRIELYGIEMTSDTEYVRQRPGGYFWIGQALGRGIEVIIHSPLLMNEKLYGYTGEIVIQKQEFEMSARKLEGLVEEAKAKTFEAKGTSFALLQALMSTKSQADANRLFEAFKRSMDNYIDLAANYGVLSGRYQENDRYMKECDELIKAAGGEKSLQAFMSIGVENATEKV